MTDRVTIVYPRTVPPELGAVTEQVDAKQVGDDTFELTGHAFLMPLGPGDVVRVASGSEVVDVVSLRPQFIYHVDLHMPSDYLAGPMPESHPARQKIERLFADWKRDAYVTELTDITAAVSTESDQWFQDNVRSSIYVEGVTLTRTPDVSSVPFEARPVV